MGKNIRTTPIYTDTPDTKSKVFGAVLGEAIGDAIGHPIEEKWMGDSTKG
jgi:hypothetical protein